MSKDFKKINVPASAYYSRAKNTEIENNKEEQTEPIKQDQQQQEQPKKKTASLRLLLYPGQHEDLKILSIVKKESVNSLLNRLVEELLEEYKEDIQAYKERNK